MTATGHTSDTITMTATGRIAETHHYNTINSYRAQIRHITVTATGHKSEAHHCNSYRAHIRDITMTATGHRAHIRHITIGITATGHKSETHHYDSYKAHITVTATGPNQRHISILKAACISRSRAMQLTVGKSYQKKKKS